MSFNDLLIHKIYKSIATSSQNDFGEWNITYTTGTSPITCRVSPWTMTEELILNRGQTVIPVGVWDNVKYKCFMDVDEPIYAGDQIMYDSKIYRVKDVITNSTSHHKSILVVEL